MIKLVVFDWNGVLIADAAASAKAVSDTFVHFGLKPFTLQKYREIFSIPARQMYIAEGMSEEDVSKYADRIQEMLHSIYEPLVSGVRMRSNARALLDFLASSGIECIISSNHTETGIRNQLKRLKIEKYFTHVIANNPYDAIRSGKEQKLKEFLEKNEIEASEIVIIGDSPEEARIRENLGLHTVAITGGYCSTKRLKEAKPDYLIHNLREMIDIIKQL